VRGHVHGNTSIDPRCMWLGTTAPRIEGWMAPTYHEQGGHCRGARVWTWHRPITDPGAVVALGIRG
jgi:hypothetical protein